MKKKISFRLQILLILVFFIIFVLGLIYTFQTQFLESFYRDEKIKLLESTAETINNSLNGNENIEEALDDILDEVSIDNEVCVRMVSNNEEIIELNKNNVCFLRRLDMDTINKMAKEAVDNGGEKLFTNNQIFDGPGVPPQGPDNTNPQDIRNNQTYIYGLMGDYKGDLVFVMVSSLISPLSATISTIKSQFSIIVAAVLLATIVLAMLLSRYIIKPIKSINNESTNLPKGKYSKDKLNTVNLELSTLNETLGTANEEILKADKAKRELLGNVSHDLRTPLTMIVGYGEMIRDLPNENTEDNVNVIIDEAKRLSTLVDDLIDVSKSESGAIELRKQKCSLNELLESVYHQYHNYCVEKNVDLRLELIEDKEVYVDISRLKQVIYNFINNSLNYNTKEDKKIVLGVEKHGGFYRVYVYDNGHGIAEKDIDAIWDRYYKVDKEHLRHHLGSGIGLSLARELLVLHGFNYGVESKEGEYSKFYFDI